ncbi:globin domain-containing protein [Pseudonocardia sp. WMMC193]|uniref:globin domain-containing protein n=1 Tax=Pseudonocardia sp. WMMC193 TaxID=2911965 RepID=UPI001EFF8562|nr:globin domain-containing protein [Pseudonocardia sp. WMMC193]MCF7553258.1 globin domain-containing protein [Pseudonocardia sp. WMMC193]
MDVVVASCQAVADRPVRLAEVFYSHLFAMAPWLRPMFAPDMTEQMQKMSDTLLAAITQLTTVDTADLEVLLYQMGQDHYTRYEVEPKHYLYVAHALTRAVREVAGWEYSSYLSSSWIAVCQWVTGHMCAGARAAIADAGRVETPVPAQRAAPSRGGHRVGRTTLT